MNGLRGIRQGGREIERFNRELREHFGVKHCFLASSGKAALMIILNALHKLYPERDEVLIPAFCCYSVPSAIVRAGLKVRLCDVDPETLDFDHTRFRQILSGYRDPNSNQFKKPGHPRDPATNSLLAIVAVHLFGMSADMDRVMKQAGRLAAAVVEDAAQVMGSEADTRKLGSMGDVGFFSLGRGKALSAVEGGIIITNNDEIGNKIGLEISKTPEYTRTALLKLVLNAAALYVFQRPSLFWFPKALPFLRIGETIYDPDFTVCRMTPFQAGVARNWKKKLAHFRESRQRVAREWGRMEALQVLADRYSDNGRRPNFLRYPLRLRDRRIWHRLLRLGESTGLGIMLTYPGSIDEIKELRGHFRGQDFPGARHLARHLLSLPVHPLLSNGDILKIKSALAIVAGSASNRKAGEDHRLN
jgi:dTDP-4-amino-4,6-dideoxygalactose transaminase